MDKQKGIIEEDMCSNIENMQCVLLAGGLGTRLSEETHLKPKPMVEIGGKPILWHIMKIYRTFGIKKFVDKIKKNNKEFFFINNYMGQCILIKK